MVAKYLVVRYSSTAICYNSMVWCIFVFKQKTAYELRISDWSSDVCSSDLVERRLDRRLGAAVERARRFVEDQDRRVFQQRSRDRDTLLLAARQLEPALADLGLLPLRQQRDETVDRRALGRRRNLLRARIGTAIGDVVADRIVEQHRVLRNDPDLGAQALLGHRLDVLPVDRHPPTLRVIEAKEQSRDRRLARPRRPDARQRLARADRQADAVQYRPVRFVADDDILDSHRPTGPDHRPGPASVANPGRGLH